MATNSDPRHKRKESRQPGLEVLGRSSRRLGWSRVSVQTRHTEEETGTLGQTVMGKLRSLGELVSVLKSGDMLCKSQVFLGRQHAAFAECRLWLQEHDCFGSSKTQMPRRGYKCEVCGGQCPCQMLGKEAVVVSLLVFLMTPCDRCEARSRCGFDLHFSDRWPHGASFQAPARHLYVSLRKKVASPLPIFNSIFCCY